MVLSRPVYWLIWGCAALLLIRALAQLWVPLMPQEAYYWMYSEHRSLSYFDHPPMVAWLIRLGTTLFGDNEWGVRFVGSVLMLLNGGLMYRFARLWWGRRVALISAVLIEVSPIYLGLGFLATMDSALLSFWLLALIGFSAAVKRGQVWGWYLCGLGLGGALLSKYTGVFLIPGVGVLLMAHRPWRKYLFSPHPYLALLFGLAMFWPVVLWNWQHDWASFRFQFVNRFDIGPSAHHQHPMLEFIGQQLGVATPVVILAFAPVLYLGLRRGRLNSRDKIALAFSLPLLLAVSHKAWGYPIHINWTAPAYLSFIPAAWQALRVRLRASRTWPTWLRRQGLALPTLAICTVCSLATVLFLLTLQGRMHLFRAFGPWDGLADVVEKYEDALEAKTGSEPMVIGNGKYELASELAFYRNRIAADDTPANSTTSQFAVGGDGLGFAYWPSAGLRLGQNCLFVDENGDDRAKVDGRFKRLNVVWNGKASNGRRYQLTECYEYLGETSLPQAD